MMSVTALLSVLRFVVFILLMLLMPTFVRSADQKSAWDKVEKKYFQTLDDWVSRGGPMKELEETVVKTCGKLVMLTAGAQDKMAMLTANRREYDFRVDVCVKSTAHRIYPQSEFENKEIMKSLCASQESLFVKLLAWSGLRETKCS